MGGVLGAGKCGEQPWEILHHRDNFSALSRGDKFSFTRRHKFLAAALLQDSRDGAGQRMNRWAHMAFGTSLSSRKTERSRALASTGMTGLGQPVRGPVIGEKWRAGARADLVLYGYKRGR